jgi:hypothetical protein
VTVSVTVTGPGAVHVKFVAAELGAENVPLGADHAYVTAAGFGAVAVPVRETLLPTVTSAGVADTPLAVAQEYVWPLKLADPASGTVPLHCRSTATLVVVLAEIENVAEPAHVTVPSTLVAVSVTV